MSPASLCSWPWFIEIVGKNTEESLQNDLALFNALQEGRQAEMEKKSAEFQEETRKAEETNRIMGCIRESPRRAANHCQRCGSWFLPVGRVWRWLRWDLR